MSLPFCRADPCEDVFCGPNAECMLINGQPKCMCAAGFTGGAAAGCSDVDECAGSPCAPGAVCRNNRGGFVCECPSGAEGDPYRQGCRETKEAGCGPNQPCPANEECVRDPGVDADVCVCQRGYRRDGAFGRCVDVDECTEEPTAAAQACGANAICTNRPGTYDCACPPGFTGNPFSGCEKGGCWRHQR